MDPQNRPKISNGTKNGINKTYTLSSPLNSGTTHQFFINGQLLKYTIDYTISGTTLTISSDRPAPYSTDILTLYGSIGVTIGVTEEQTIINAIIFG